MLVVWSLNAKFEPDRDKADKSAKLCIQFPWDMSVKSEMSAQEKNLLPYKIGQFEKYHNTLCLSPQILHKHCFCFPLGLLYFPRETENNAYLKFGGTNREYYGIFRSGLLETLLIIVLLCLVTTLFLKIAFATVLKGKMAQNQCKDFPDC